MGANFRADISDTSCLRNKQTKITSDRDLEWDMEAPPADVSDIIRRRRSRTLQEEKVEITFEDLQACFHLPLAEVARLFGVGTTFMKKRCRIHGIKRWPFRKIRSEAGRRQNDTS